ncbi:MAG: NAD(P)H-hydrate epimerase [Candidatus Omnitrophica bacterium]|nr:NAD(P)H-hydrate epimerase [Candidatus Omnitrophota bacterium]
MPSQSPESISVSQMRAIDAAAIERFGIPRLLLMEHAGLALARFAQEHIQEDRSSLILVCCGSGYNGGDGLAAARHLHEWGYSVKTVLIGPVSHLREEPFIYANILQQLGIAPLELGGKENSDAWRCFEEWVQQSPLIIDALLGIGGKGMVREPLSSIIATINRSGHSVLAADVPSGLDADTGLVRGIAVRATATVSFGFAKRGCFIGQGPAHTGKLRVDSITIPAVCYDAIKTK